MNIFGKKKKKEKEKQYETQKYIKITTLNHDSETQCTVLKNSIFLWGIAVNILLREPDFLITHQTHSLGPLHLGPRAVIYEQPPSQMRQ
jgi:hypothetical protein